jgi:GntR family transcriptional regulator, transcriptional repressor for pyruvate dehydrogenase complex
MKRATDRVEAALLDYTFHKTRIDGACNQTLSRVYRILKPVLTRLMEAAQIMRRAFEGAYAEHAAIIAGLRAKDRLAYLHHMDRHLDAGLEFIPPAKVAETDWSP